MFAVEIKELGAIQRTNSGYFQQTPFWSEFKAAHGWTFRAFRISWKKDESGADADLCGEEDVCVLTRAFLHGKLTIAYVPLFPSLPAKDIAANEQNIEFSNLLNDIALSLKPFLPKNTLCIRFDPAVGFDTPDERDYFVRGIKVIAFADRLRLKKSRVDIQPPDSTRIFLEPTEEELLSAMKSKWRYNINLSARKGVTVTRTTGAEEALDAELDVFYDLHKITAERDGIAIHSRDYYRDLLVKSAEERTAGKDVPVVSLYIARHEADALGAIITLNSKTESIYLYGCSSNVKRNLMPNFLLQWTAMKDAKAYGSHWYDMYGMPPTDDENHPMHGLYLFKTGFGGKNIHRIGSIDVPLSALYRLYDCAERARAFWHKKILKKIRGR